MDFDYVFDVVVVGSGGGGLTAALVANDAGLDVVVVEKQKYYGGSTALSGGGIWAPNNFLSEEAGVEDSKENAMLYLNNTVGDRVAMEKKRAYVENAPDMITWLCDNANLKLKHVPNYSDYHPERPGGVSKGRAVESVPFNGKKLGKDLQFLNKSDIEVPMNISFTIEEYGKLNLVRSTWSGKFTALKAGIRGLVSTLLRRKILTLGAALVAQLRLAVKERNIPLWLECPLKELITEEGKVVGIIAEKEGKKILIGAKNGVLLATGGFPHNLEMREKYMPAPQSTAWTSANKGNTGDGIRAGIAVGAATDLLDDAWWGPSSITPDKGPFFHVAERSMPGSIMVNGQGKRYTNEAASYTVVGHEMFENHSKENPHIPSHIIFDQHYKNKYLFGAVFPGMDFPDEYYEAGYVKSADSIEELAMKLDLDEDNLVKTVQQFNEYARKGKDDDFGRGENAYDNYYGDPTVEPNPNLYPLENPPFYGIEMYPGDLGTKGGLLTNEHGQVLKSDDSVIEGLYATGNNMASVMGHYYPGPGSAVGSTMTYGFIAANHIATKTR